MQKLYIMCGIPGSGKTTFVKNRIIKNFGTDSIHISRDYIREILVEEDEKFNYKKEDLVFKKFCDQINKHLLIEKHIYADATNLNKKSRKKLLNEINKNVDLEIIAIVMNTDLNKCIERNSKRKGTAFVPENVIKNMYNSFEDPSIDEGFDSIINIF